MKVAIHQPNFIPWAGYFNKINLCDTFVILDDVQFERGKTFTSRTKLLQNGIEQWLTIPVIGKSSLVDINKILVDESFIWKRKHLKTLYINYKKSPYFYEIYPIIEQGYNIDSSKLIDYNINFINIILSYLGIQRNIVFSSSLLENSSLTGWDKIFFILKTLNTNEYLSGAGSGSKRYVNESQLSINGINLIWQEYSLNEYPQLNRSDFSSTLSILDLLFMQGKDAINFI